MCVRIIGVEGCGIYRSPIFTCLHEYTRSEKVYSVYRMVLVSGPEFNLFSLNIYRVEMTGCEIIKQRIQDIFLIRKLLEFPTFFFHFIIFLCASVVDYGFNCILKGDPCLVRSSTLKLLQAWAQQLG